MFPFNLRIAAIVLGVLLCGNEAAAANTTLAPIIIPAPPGPYATDLKIQVMVDTSRPDPFNSTEKTRKILTSVFTPVAKHDCPKLCTAPYMPPKTAAGEDAAIGSPQPLFARLQLSGLCCSNSSSSSSPSSSHGRHKPEPDPPLVIWSPGFGESRLIWSAMAQYLASYGYRVVTVDHPGDGSIVEFPDGSVVRSTLDGSNSSDALRDFTLNVETADVLFVIDELSKGGSGNRGHGHGSGGDAGGKVGVVAHGAIASQAMLNDSLNGHPGRIAAGVNLDGRYNGPVLTEGNGAGAKAFILWVPPSGPNNATSWDLWWNITDKLNPGAWRRELQVANETQGSISDLPLLADLSGFRKADPGINATLGTIAGARSVSIFTTYHAAFFDMFLKGDKESLLNGPSAAFPEVTIVRSAP